MILDCARILRTVAAQDADALIVLPK